MMLSMLIPKRLRNFIKIIKENNALLHENNELLKQIKKRISVMDVPIDYKKFWQEDNLVSIIPLNQGENPEGFFPGDIINQMLEDKPYDTILDLGCGYGRLSKAFNPDKYMGLDLNFRAIEMAKKNNPEYKYLETSIGNEYPKCDMVLAYTVFLHLDDATLTDMLLEIEKTGCKNVLICEILGREWEKGFVPPSFVRDLEDYDKLLSKVGFKRIKKIDKPYKRYIEDSNFDHIKNKDISFLLYERCNCL